MDHRGAGCDHGGGQPDAGGHHGGAVCMEQAEENDIQTTPAEHRLRGVVLRGIVNIWEVWSGKPSLL